jgi:hypothetical protein
LHRGFDAHMRAWGIQVGETSIELCSQLGQRRLLALLGALGQRRQNVQSPKFAILANPSSGGRPATIVARGVARCYYRS